MKPEKLCCYCKLLNTEIEGVSPEEFVAHHRCKVDNAEVEWSKQCRNGKFESKSEIKSKI